MAKRSLPHSGPWVTQAEFDMIDSAKYQIADAHRSLSLAVATFDADDGTPRIDAQVILTLANTARAALAQASEVIADLAAFAEPARFDLSEKCYDAIDVVSVIGCALQRGGYPEKAGPTSSPIRGSLSVAARLVDELESEWRTCWYGARVKATRGSPPPTLAEVCHV